MCAVRGSCSTEIRFSSGWLLPLVCFAFPIQCSGFAIPVIANLALWFNRVFLIKNNYYILSLGQVIFIVIYVSIVFEGLLPLISKTYTADWLDILLYIFGGSFFYMVMNKPIFERR